MRLKIPYISSTVASDVVFTIYFAFFWWFLGFSIVVYQLVALWLFNKLLLHKIKYPVKIRLPRIILFPAVFTVLYGISIILNASQHDQQRITASLYNFSFWIMGILLVLVMYNTCTAESIDRIVTAMGINIVAIGASAIVSLFLWVQGQTDISMRTPVLTALPWLENIPLLRQALTIRFLGSDWFSASAQPRLMILNPYPTALAATLIMILPLYAAHSTSKKAYRFTALAVGLLALVFTLSRTSIIAFIIAIGFIYLLNHKHKLIIAVTALLIIITAWPILVMSYEQVSDLRKDSSEIRARLYRQTIETALKQSPLIGIGVKPRDEFFIPTGSHSMILSVFLRTGMLGLAAFIAMQWQIAKTWYQGLKRVAESAKQTWNAIGISLFAMLLWMTTEDLDAPQLVAFLYFLLLGLMAIMVKEGSDGNDKQTQHS